MYLNRQVLRIVVAVGCMSGCLFAEDVQVGPDKTFKSISSALAEMRDGDTCIVNTGVYRERIDVSLNNVSIRGVGRVVITGCDVAEEWKSARINGRACKTAPVQTEVYDVFWGERYLSPARYPNKVHPMTSNRDWAYTTIDKNGAVVFRDPKYKDVPKVTDGYYVGLHSHSRLSSWCSLTLPIKSTGAKGEIHVDEATASSGYMGKHGQGNGLGYIIGARAALNAPGEWYADGKQLTLIPPAKGSGNYEFRTRLYGAMISGNGVRLENIRFRAATARVDGNNVSFTNCLFEYISPFRHNAHRPPGSKTGQSLASGWGIPDNGTAGVFVKGDGFVAENCVFSKSWWSGMTLRGSKARIENCLFEDMNWMAKRCAALFCWGDDNVVRYCTFRNLGAAGIEGGNAVWVQQYAKRNVWEYNYIEDICKLIVDQGFFYVNHQSGSNPKANSIWRYNVGVKGRGPEKGNWTNCVGGYYIDNNSSGYHVHNNIAVDVKQALKYNDFRDGPQAGKDIWYYNNTLYKCPDLGHGVKGKRDAELVLVNNLLISSKKRFGKHPGWQNNIDSLPDSAVKDPKSMDFTPMTKRLRTGGVPVLGETIPYIGAVDPKKGMWRYGANVRTLPKY